MRIESKHKLWTVPVALGDGRGHSLAVYHSLTGEVEPILAPLPIDYSLDGNTLTTWRSRRGSSRATERR